MPRLSVVIPAYNAAAFLPQALKSVLAQTYSDYEVIVVDDGSLDDTAQVVALFAAHDKRVRLICSTNQGVGPARNVGIENAQGEWIAFLDADDWWSPTKLSTQVDYLDSKPQLVAVSTYGKYTGGTGKSLGVLEFGPTSEEQLTTLRRKAKPIWLLTPSVVCRRSILDDLGGFNADFLGAAEDLDLWTRLGMSFPVQTIPEHHVHVRVSRGSVSMVKHRVIQQHTLWVRQNAARLSQGDRCLTKSEFEDWFQAQDVALVQKWERSWRSAFHYRHAGLAALDGHYLASVSHLIQSFLASPGLPLEKIKRQILTTFDR